MIRIDMSEYGEKHTVSRLTGPPPGYVGYEEGGHLTEAVRRAPHSVILLDELEKAHPDVLNILLQMMDDGILTDGKGRTVSFKNTIIIMTSNIGSKQILKMAQTSATGRRPTYTKLSALVKRELDKAMRPEFLNRIDEVVIFQPLTEDELVEIAWRMALDIVVRTKMDRNVDILVQPSLLKQMVKEGSKAASQFGARPMRRAVQRILEDAISTAVMKSFVKAGDTASFDLEREFNEDCELEDAFTYVVTISRERDNEVLCVEIEESCWDMVADFDGDDEDDEPLGANSRVNGADLEQTHPNGVKVQIEHETDPV